MIRGLPTGSPVVRFISRRMVPFILLYGLYVVGHGEDGPGGGFQGGVIIAAAYVLLGLSEGWYAGRRAVPQGFSDSMMPMGALFFAGIGFGAFLAGGAFLQYAAYAPEHAHTAHHFGLIGIEVGVTITVAGSMVTLFFEMARPRSERRGETDPDPTDEGAARPAEEQGPEAVEGSDA